MAILADLPSCVMRGVSSEVRSTSPNVIKAVSNGRGELKRTSSLMTSEPEREAIDKQHRASEANQQLPLVGIQCIFGFGCV